MDNLGQRGQFQNPQVLRQADLTDLPEQDKDTLKMETFGKCHRIKPESSAGSYLHTPLELTIDANKAGDWPMLTVT